MSVEIGLIKCDYEKDDLNLVQDKLNGIKNLCVNVRVNQSLILLSRFQSQENAQTEIITDNTQITCTYVDYPVCYLDPMSSHMKKN